MKIKTDLLSVTATVLFLTGRGLLKLHRWIMKADVNLIEAKSGMIKWSCTAIMIVSLPAYTQEPRGQDAKSSRSLEDLVSEVRQLRVVVEQSTISSFMLQAAQRQEERVEKLQKSLEAFKAQMALTVAAASQLPKDLKEAEESGAAEQNPGRRKELLRLAQQLKEELEQQGTRQQQQQIQESNIIRRLTAEQAKLEERESELAVFEKSLKGIRPTVNQK